MSFQIMCHEFQLKLFSMPVLHEKESGVHEKAGAVRPYIV